jgi:glycosyltransferase involved in cell wall biosynthesis
MSRLRVLHVVPSYLPAARYGGPIHAVHGLCRSLAERGHQVEVATTDVDGPGRSPVPLGEPVERDGVRIWYFATGPGRRLYRAPGLRRHLESAIPGMHLVHLHSVFLWPTMVAARIAEDSSVPYLVAPRGMLVPELIRVRSWLVKSAWLRLVEARTLRRAAALHVTSGLEAREAARIGLALPPAVEVPNGLCAPGDVDGRLAPRLQAALPTGPFVLYLGRISWKKRLDRLIDACATLPDVYLVLAGYDDERLRPSLEDRASDAGMAGRIVFLGPVDGQEKWSLLRAAALLALVSDAENFGNVVLEAMSQCRPVVVTPGVGLADAVARAGAGLVSEPSPAAIASSMAQVLGDPNRARQMGEAGARLVRERFSWPRVAERMEAVYRRLLAARERVPSC